MHVQRAVRRRNRQSWQLVVDVSAALFLVMFIVYQVRFLAGHLQAPQYQNTTSRPVAGNSTPPAPADLQLGFPYPQLQNTRQLVEALVSQQGQLSWSELTAAYGAALHASLQQHPTNSSTAADATKTSYAHRNLQALLHEAFSLLSSDSGLLQCTGDATLLAAWQAATPALTPAHTASAAFESKRLQDRHYLLAANFHNSADVLPNFIVQTLQLALLLPHGHIAVSLYESGSSDTTRMWLTLMHQLLLPLGIPHHITAAGELSPRLRLGRIQLLAALRNALLEPWLPQSQPGKQQRQQHPGQQQATALQHQSWWQRVWTAGAAADSHAAAAAAAGAAVLQHSTAGYTPDTFVFANDVFFCAEDALRLIMHGADIACGMDFYTAPWQQQEQLLQHQRQHGSTPAASSGSSKSQGGGSAAKSHSSSAEHASGVESGSNASSSTMNAAYYADDEDTLHDSDNQQLQQQLSAGSSTGSHDTLRFYDKWVARDAAGARLLNRAPFIRHGPSQAQLAAGQPVAMTCCWNGLAAVTSAPFTAGLRFRSHQPGECQASECSLMCDDFARLGFTHVVMDPGVRLAYDRQQLNSLAAAAATQHAAAAAQVKGGVNTPPVAGLGRRLDWQQIAAASQRLAAAAAQSKAAAAQAAMNCSRLHQGSCAVVGKHFRECCDLQPGHSYVNFKRDCHVVDVMAHNYTAAAAAG